MSDIPTIISKLGQIQPSLWQTVSNAASEAANDLITIDNPFALPMPVTQITVDYPQPQIVVQFAFSTAPDQMQLLIVPQDTAMELANRLLESNAVSVDDNLTAELRPFFESLVQGICLGASNLMNEAVVATGLSIRLMTIQVPMNFQRHSDVILTNLGVSAEAISGTIMWMIDPDTAAYLCGLEATVDDEPAPAASPFAEFAAPTAAGTRAAQARPVETHDGLELLMDIPLEVSVELGRVRMQVREVVDLGAGSIVEIDKAAGEPVDVLVNGRLVAKGEVVVIEDNFGVRITEILTPQERLSRLNEAA